ncbi:trypsin-like peptidase domain-containing protein [Ornithinimicrobium sp. F0845]|uniref:S1C family serine protease n=1 Tax=Ornithinimicrobium sp. F0845 TaxID=2926412 RepID=UPI001FF6D2E6|nr:trypsin-like peptidase domain-containing protein [Ornithinimicrobium sp. F0845]MCK0111070.1 trypsin-like peptidase domain-containing protein [Ornithinimicrobium sp. F0845]
MADERDRTGEDAAASGVSPDESTPAPQDTWTFGRPDAQLTGRDPEAQRGPELPPEARIDQTSGIPVDSTAAFPVHSAYAPPTGASHSSYPPPLAEAGHPTYSTVRAAGPAATGATALPRPARRGRRGSAGLLAGALALGLLGGGAAGFLGAQVAAENQEPLPTILEAVPVGTTPPTQVTAIAQHALPSVVFISVGSASADGVGSGFVVRENGYIVTNSHVIEAATDGGSISVQFSDGQEFEAEVVGADLEYDVAVIKVDRTGLQPLQFGDSDQLQVGASVVAVGAPLGLDNTVTSGIVSALNRPVIAGGGGGGQPSYINAIQTDAAINPGNSGGPLLDLNGDVVGVNSAIAQIPGELGGQAGSIGLGFAIPARQAEHTATQLIETGTSNHPIIGVLLDMRHTGEGAKVLEEAPDGSDPVVDGGPADQAGVQPGDLILAVDGQRIDHGSHLIIVLRSHAIGDEVELLLEAPDGSERTVTMTLQGSE